MCISLCLCFLLPFTCRTHTYFNVRMESAVLRVTRIFVVSRTFFELQTQTRPQKYKKLKQQQQNMRRGSDAMSEMTSHQTSSCESARSHVLHARDIQREREGPHSNRQTVNVDAGVAVAVVCPLVADEMTHKTHKPNVYTYIHAYLYISMCVFCI